jgi:hypothetical protein
MFEIGIRPSRHVRVFGQVRERIHAEEATKRGLMTSHLELQPRSISALS